MANLLGSILMSEIEGLKSATETTKQIITLSTGVVTLTITFYDKFNTDSAQAAGAPWSLCAAWVLFGLCIVSALATLGAITGTLHHIDRQANGQTLTPAQLQLVNNMSDARNVRIPARIMAVLFIFGMAFTIAAGISIGL